ncbi:hypothetical protein D3C81_2172710 [compost metagenome]
MGTFLHQHGEQLETDRVELERLARAVDFQGVEVVAEVGHLQAALAATLGAAQHRLDAGG